MDWTKEEIKHLKENYEKNPNIEEVAKKIGRSIRAVRHKGYRLGLSRPRFKRGPSKNKQPQKVIYRRYYIKNREKVYRRKRERVSKLRKELKMMLGGKCKKCRYNKSLSALDFHHEGKKEMVISRLILNDSKRKALKEIKKCILLCANCHRELHYGG